MDITGRLVTENGFDFVTKNNFTDVGFKSHNSLKSIGSVLLGEDIYVTALRSFILGKEITTDTDMSIISALILGEDIGVVDNSHSFLALGAGHSLSSANYSIVNGEDNTIVDSAGSFVIGGSNSVESSHNAWVSGSHNSIDNSYNVIVKGNENTCVGLASIVMGGDNEYYCNYGLLMGYGSKVGTNTSALNYAVAIGEGHVLTEDYQTAFGKYANMVDMIFAIGIGSSGQPLNGFQIDTDYVIGCGAQHLNITKDYHVPTLGWVARSTDYLRVFSDGNNLVFGWDSNKKCGWGTFSSGTFTLVVPLPAMPIVSEIYSITSSSWYSARKVAGGYEWLYMYYDSDYDLYTIQRDTNTTFPDWLKSTLDRAFATEGSFDGETLLYSHTGTDTGYSIGWAPADYTEDQASGFVVAPFTEHAMKAAAGETLTATTVTVGSSSRPVLRWA
jgi:hypothetical protein